VGPKTLLADEHGRFAFAPEPLPGAEPDARELGARSLASWAGPANHLLILEKDGAAMPLERAKAAVDFAFRSPAPGLSFELEPGAGGDAAWAAAAFAMGYAERKAEWSKRAARFTVRLRRHPEERQRELLERHKADARWLASADEKPEVPISAQRVLLLVGPKAANPAAWVRAAAAAGAASMLLEPAGVEPGFFAKFYDEALNAFLGQESLVEERAVAFLSRRRERLPGYDVLNELAYLPDGSIRSSEAGLRLADTLADLYHELGDSPVVRACLAAAVPDNQPSCQGCVYRSHCAVPPSRHFAAQGSLWGRMPESPWCALHMAVLDAVFSRLADENSAFVLRRWAENSR
jgi:hypothetical protein